MKKILLALIIGLFILACNNNASDKKLNADSVVTKNKDSASPINNRDILDTLPLNDSLANNIISETVSVKSLSVINLTKSIKNNNQSVHIKLTDVKPGKLNISIKHSKPNANIRISQVMLPDSTTDGPFGQQLNLKAKQKGNYTVIINKSNMASGSQVGDVFITIKK